MGLAQTRHQMAGTQLGHTSSPAACQLFFTEMLGQRVTSHAIPCSSPQWVKRMLVGICSGSLSCPLGSGTCSSLQTGPGTGSLTPSHPIPLWVGHGKLRKSLEPGRYTPDINYAQIQNGGSRRHKPNTIHKLSLHRQASVSRKMITMEPKRWVDYVEPSRLQSLGEDKQGTGLLSDSKAGRVDR